MTTAEGEIDSAEKPEIKISPESWICRALTGEIWHITSLL